MIYEYAYIKDFLKNQLEQRIQANPRYSMRSFAKALGIHAAELSLVLRGERTLSYTSSQKVIQNLGLTPGQQKKFMEVLQFEKNGVTIIDSPPDSKTHLQVDKFQKISKWYHFAILNLLNTPNFKWTPAHISKRLGISQIEAGFAMQDLLAEGMVSLQTNKSKKNPQLKVIQVETPLPSSVIRNYHHQVLGKAQEALQEIPMDYREFQSVGITCSIKDIPKIKAALNELTDSFIEQQHKPNGEEVYQLQVCFFPLTKTTKES